MLERFEVNKKSVQVFNLRLADMLDSANGCRINGLVDRILSKSMAKVSHAAFIQFYFKNTDFFTAEELEVIKDKL